MLATGTAYILVHESFFWKKGIILIGGMPGFKSGHGYNFIKTTRISKTIYNTSMERKINSQK
jgi:hypothetical protein